MPRETLCAATKKAGKLSVRLLCECHEEVMNSSETLVLVTPVQCGVAFRVKSATPLI